MQIIYIFFIQTNFISLQIDNVKETQIIMPFQKGNKVGGRNKGSLNKTTQDVKEVLARVLDGREESIQLTLDGLEGKDYIDAISKLLPYVIPKKSDVTSGDEPIKQNLNIIVDNPKTGKTLIQLRNGAKAD